MMFRDFRPTFLQMKIKAVRIENPLPGGAAFTTMNRARRHIKRGRAIFTGERSIRFVTAACAAKAASENSEAKLHSRVTGGWYDSISKVIQRPTAEDDKTTRLVANTHSHHPRRSAAYGPETWDAAREVLVSAQLDAAAL